MLTSYLRKDAKYIKVFRDETSVGIVLAFFSDENLQSYNLGQNLSERFCVYAFLIFSFPHTGSLCKKAGQCTKAGIYHGRLKNMYQVHKTFKILL